MDENGLKQATDQLLSDQVDLLVARTRLEAADVSGRNSHEIQQINLRMNQLKQSSSLLQQWMFGDLETCRDQVADYPYDPLRRFFLADCYEHLGYPDLAVGEMYKALLLIDEILDECGEYSEEAFNSIARLFHDSDERDTEEVSVSYRVDVHEFIQSLSVSV